MSMIKKVFTVSSFGAPEGALSLLVVIASNPAPDQLL
jgi:hypothetical protein